MSPDLVQRLIDAAAEAIRNEAPALLHDPARLRGLNLELTIANGGQIVDYRAWGEWRGTIRRKEA